MNFIRTAARDEVVALYFARESAKGRHVPEAPFPAHPDSLDRLLQSLVFKPGVIAGYESWNYVELDLDDLANCAIFEGMAAREFPAARSQRLGDITRCARFRQWVPDRTTTWDKELVMVPRNQAYPDAMALILRPALPHEGGANWYIEDGSGRATFWLRRMITDGVGPALAFVGQVPDARSSFIRQFADGALLKR